MSDPSTPPPISDIDGREPEHAPVVFSASGPAPMSKTAVVGFVSSLIVFVPFLAPLVGLVCGIIGIFVTSGGRRRGRKLAIAAVVIAALAGTTQGYFTQKLVVQYKALGALARQIDGLFRVSGSRVHEVAPAVYSRGSKRFKLVVSAEQFEAWIRDVVARHGQLQSVEPGPTPIENRTSETLVVHQIGHFVKGTAAIDIHCCNTGGAEWEFDDIRVDGESPMPDYD